MMASTIAVAVRIEECIKFKTSEEVNRISPRKYRVTSGKFTNVGTYDIKYIYLLHVEILGYRDAT